MAECPLTRHRPQVRRARHTHTRHNNLRKCYELQVLLTEIESKQGTPWYHIRAPPYAPDETPRAHTPRTHSPHQCRRGSALRRRTPHKAHNE
eukprot:5973801-Prymnesium_polylepis.1